MIAIFLYFRWKYLFSQRLHLFVESHVGQHTKFLQRHCTISIATSLKFELFVATINCKTESYSVWSSFASLTNQLYSLLKRFCSKTATNIMAPESTSAAATDDDDGKTVVVLVNPQGCSLSQEIMRRGHVIVALWTREALKDVANVQYHTEVTEQRTLDDTLQLVSLCISEPHTIVACFAGAQDGIELANHVSQGLGLSSSQTLVDKQMQQETVKAAGMRSIRQVMGSTFEQVQDYLKTEAYPLVVKPISSSEEAKLCHNFADAEQHVHKLLQSFAAVVCQEFLRGKEYAFDAVSCDGIHKITMMWAYDKRPVNGAAQVHFGCVPIESESPEMVPLIPYLRGVLNSLAIQDGPTHTKIMFTSDGPCLVELASRLHGGDGIWRPLCRALTGGYSQIEATIDAFTAPTEFAKLADKPPPFKAFGQEIILVSYSKGTVKGTPGFDLLELLPSFMVMESSVVVGSKVDYTVDLATSLGRVILVHSDKATLQRDIDFLRHMEKINGFCVYEARQENLVHPRGDRPPTGPKNRHAFSADGPSLIRHLSMDRPELRPLRRTMTTMDASKEVVVLVDPYSTGCCVAQEIQKRGYNIMALWTLGFAEAMKLHIPLSCEGLKYIAETDQAETLEDTATRIQQAAGSLRVVGVMAGGEAGVVFADVLSEHMNLRSNGTDVPNRCDKKIQQELIKNAGFRATRQAGGSVFEEVEEFLNTEPFPIVLKPTESAGSDGVKLCHTFEEAKDHFNLLMASQMVNGGACGSVLCQEFLRGKEYVIDHASRDGIHKTMMLWVYDKRPANGSHFVYFKCSPVDPESPVAKILIPYVRGVLDVLGVRNGASHGEVMMTPTGPCLVEMNCRANGGDGNWRPLCLALTGGYSQVEATVDSYLEKKAFFALPDKPPSPLKAHGHETFLVSYSRGTVKSTPGLEKIKQFESFVYLETGVKAGSKVDYTIDFITCVGSIILMHKDKEVVESDLRRLREMEVKNELFEYEEELSMPKSFSKTHLSEAIDEGERQNRVISSDRPEMFD